MTAHTFLALAAVALATLGTCCGVLAGHCVDEARAYPSSRWAFRRDAVANALVGALCFGLALAAACYS